MYLSSTANGMSEAVTNPVAIYMLICRDLNQPRTFPGNEYFWKSIDDNSYAPSLADLSVWANSQEHCKDEVFNHCNGDAFVWEYMWKDIAEYFGVHIQISLPSHNSTVPRLTHLCLEGFQAQICERYRSG